MGTAEAQDGAMGQGSPFANLFLKYLGRRRGGTEGIITNLDVDALLQKFPLTPDENGRLLEPHHRDFASGEGRFVFIPVKATLGE